MFLNTRALEVVAFKYSNKLDLCFMVLPEDIEDLIIDWLTGEISPEGENQLQEWVKTDHKHRDLYVQYCSVWYGTRIGEEKRTGMDEKWLTITRKHQKRRQKFILHWVASVATPTEVPLITTDTPGKGRPFSSMTLPLTTFSCT